MFREVRTESEASDAWRRDVEAHLLRLDAESLELRFLSGTTPEAISAYVSRMSPHAVILFMPDGHVRGLAEIHGCLECVSEVAFTLEAGWRGRGIGLELAREAVAAARRDGYQDIQMSCLRRNGAMMRIARKLSAVALPVADWTLATFSLRDLAGT